MEHYGITDTLWPEKRLIYLPPPPPAGTPSPHPPPMSLNTIARKVRKETPYERISFSILLCRYEVLCHILFIGSKVLGSDECSFFRPVAPPGLHIPTSQGSRYFFQSLVTYNSRYRGTCDQEYGEIGPRISPLYVLFIDTLKYLQMIDNPPPPHLPASALMLQQL